MKVLEKKKSKFAFETFVNHTQTTYVHWPSKHPFAQISTYQNTCNAFYPPILKFKPGNMLNREGHKMRVLKPKIIDTMKCRSSTPTSRLWLLNIGHGVQSIQHKRHLYASASQWCTEHSTQASLVCLRLPNYYLLPYTLDIWRNLVISSHFQWFPVTSFNTFFVAEISDFCGNFPNIIYKICDQYLNQVQSHNSI